MRRFERAACPAFWSEREAAWLASAPRSSGKDAFRSRTFENRPLARWFHELVRASDPSRNCAYCDGPLGETTPPTIDHFIPEREAPELGLSWENLYPACGACNSVHKRDQWDVFLLRPEAVEDQWFDVDPQDGQIRPAPDLDPITSRYVRYTIELLGLDTPERRRARRRAWHTVFNAWNADNIADVETLRTEGPYRLVVERFLAARL